MTPTQPDPAGRVSRGKAIRVSEALPSIRCEPEYYAPEVAKVGSHGKAVRVSTALPTIRLQMMPVSAWATLVIEVRIPEPADLAATAGRVCDVLIRLHAEDRVHGGEGFARVEPPQPPTPGTVTLALIPNGPPGAEAEPRLRELARVVASPTVTARVIPAA